jgi:hypothetical protein
MGGGVMHKSHASSIVSRTLSAAAVVRCASPTTLVRASRSVLRNAFRLYGVLVKSQFFSPSRWRSWSDDLPPRPSDSQSSTATILAVPAHITILVHVPRLAWSASLLDVTCSGGDGLLAFFPFSLALALAFHLPLEQGLGRPSTCFSACLGLETSLILEVNFCCG